MDGEKQTNAKRNPLCSLACSAGAACCARAGDDGGGGAAAAGGRPFFWEQGTEAPAVVAGLPASGAAACYRLVSCRHIVECVLCIVQFKVIYWLI